MQIEGNCSSMVIGRASLLRLAGRACRAPQSSTSLRSTSASAAPLGFALSSGTLSSLSAVSPRIPAAASHLFSSSSSAFSVTGHRQHSQLVAAAASSPAVDAAPPAAEAEIVPGADLTLSDLPTSDESENLLKIRHSVRFFPTLL